ncbi:MAG: Hpt domain-containing protein [Spirochaetia bacterium]|jgi:two-component system chemotaxis sensor kinase CheA
MSREHDFNIRLLGIFRTEAREHRLTILSALRELETGVDAEREAEMIEKAFRAAHTLKGAARAINKSQIADLCQSLEGIFSLLKNGQGRLGREMFHALYEAIESIEKMEAGSEDGDSTLIGRLNDIRGALDG